MKKAIILVTILFLNFNSQSIADSPSFDNPGKFTSEFHFGLRIPTGNASKDILSGFALKLGFGYQLTKNLEIFHLAFDFGNSSPHDPLWVQVYDPYSYYPTLQQETVNVFGFPLTMRWRSRIKEQLELYLGAGAAYYWFTTRLADPYWGIDYKKSRKRHGPGGLVEAGVFTDAFSEKLLVGLISNLTFVKTKGETLTTSQSSDSPDKIVSRTDVYLTFAICLRYYMKK